MLGYGTSGLTVLRDKTSVAYLPSCHLFTLLPIRITVETNTFLIVLLALPHPLMLGYGTSGLTVLRDKTSVAYLPSCHLFTLLPIRITVETNTFLIVLLALPHPLMYE